MTKKDYQLLANVIKGRLDNVSHLDKLGWSIKEQELAKDVIGDVTVHLVSELCQDNPKFDIAKFNKACGVE